MTPWQQFVLNISNLLKVKTIITLALVFTFCYLTLQEITINSQFMYIAIAVFTYYFAKPNNPKAPKINNIFNREENENET